MAVRNVPDVAYEPSATVSVTAAPPSSAMVNWLLWAAADTATGVPAKSCADVNVDTAAPKVASVAWPMSTEEPAPGVPEEVRVSLLPLFASQAAVRPCPETAVWTAVRNAPDVAYEPSATVSFTAAPPSTVTLNSLLWAAADTTIGVPAKSCADVNVDTCAPKLAVVAAPMLTEEATPAVWAEVRVSAPTPGTPPSAR